MEEGATSGGETLGVISGRVMSTKEAAGIDSSTGVGDDNSTIKEENKLGK